MRGWFGLAAFAIGCTGGGWNDGGQFGEEGGARCEEASRTQLAADETSPLGFAPQAILDLLVGPRDETLTWASGGSTPLALEVVPDGDYAYVEQEFVSDGSGAEPALGCPNLVVVEGELTFATEDGAFDEHLPVVVQAESAALASLYDPLEQLAGAFDPWDHVPAGSDYDEARAWLEVSFDAAGASGVIEGQGSGVVGDPNDPDSTAYAEGFEVASFGGSAEGS
jgi:hypothetical protein